MPKGKRRTPELREKLDGLDLIHRLLDDRDLTGDLLLFALATVDCGLRFDKAWTSQVAQATGWDQRRIRSIVARDVPRYEPDDLKGLRRCQAPMIRRDGPCGASGSTGFHWRYNAETGEWRTYWACTRHEEGARKMIRAATMAWEANGKPQPANNSGGVLSKYFHTEGLYDWATPSYRKDTDRTPPPQRPELEVIRDEAPDLSPPARPTFVVVK